MNVRLYVQYLSFKKLQHCKKCCFLALFKCMTACACPHGEQYLTINASPTIPRILHVTNQNCKDSGKNRKPRVPFSKRFDTILDGNLDLVQCVFGLDRNQVRKHFALPDICTRLQLSPEVQSDFGLDCDQVQKFNVFSDSMAVKSGSTK